MSEEITDKLNSAEEGKPAETFMSIDEYLDEPAEKTADGSGAQKDGAADSEGAEPSSADELFGVKEPVTYHITDFDGPLDLLLEMISAAKINIREIFVSDITKQYVEIIKNTPKEDFDYEYASEFITMASTLVYLKSIVTVPHPDEEDGGESDEPDEREEFFRMVEAYKVLKEESEKLRERETVNRFTREPVYTEDDYRVSFTNFSLSKLVEAFAHILANSERAERAAIPKKVMKDRFSVQEQMRHIRQLIDMYGKFKFTFLFEPDYDRNDIVTTFLAVLELIKYGKLRAEQEEIFGEIMIFATETEGGDEEMEESDGKY